MRKTKITLSVETGEIREYETLDDVFQDLRFWFHSGKECDYEDELTNFYMLCGKYYAAKLSVRLSGITFTFERVSEKENEK